MKTSIALTTYNASQYLYKQLDSLLNQTQPVDEIIIIDDCSTDNTVELLENYVSKHNLKHWHLCVNETNVGYKKNFYKALLQTTGDYIFLCDQDDIWELDKVKKMMAVFKSNPKIQCLNTSFHLIDEHDQKIKNQPIYISKNHIDHITCDYILVRNISMGCTCCMTKKVKEIYLKYSNTCASHDWEINAIASFLDGLYYLNESLINYRIHQTNTTGLDISNDKVNPRVKNAIQIKNYLDSLNCYNEYMDDKTRNYLQQLVEFSNMRYQLVVENKKRNWFKLIKQYSIYSRYVSIKGMFIELVK